MYTIFLIDADQQGLFVTRILSELLQIMYELVDLLEA